MRPFTSKSLSELAPLSNLGTLPVEDEDRNCDAESETSENSTGVFQGSRVEVIVERRAVKSSDTSEEISCETVTTSCGRRIRSIGSDHVVNRGHVDGVICNPDKAREDHGCNPWNSCLRARRCPGETKKTNSLERSHPQQPVEATLWLHGVRSVLSHEFLIAGEEGHKAEPGDEIANSDGDVGESDLNGAEAPLFVHRAVRLEESEDQSVGETGEKRQAEDDWLGEEHAERAQHGDGQLLGWQTLEEATADFVGTVEVGVLARLALLLCDAVKDASNAGLRDQEEVKSLSNDTEDELNPEVPLPCQILADEATEDGTKD